MTQQDQAQQTDDAVDLTNCDREPIHILGTVQSYGCLIATSADMMVNHVSQNVQDLMGLDPETMIGCRLVDLLPAQTVHDLRTKLQLISINSGSSRLFGYDTLGDGRLYDVSIHASDQTYIFEFEPKTDTTSRDEMALVQPLLARVKKADNVNDACQQAARAMQALSGFDRVMIYKFDDDGSGEVIAERHSPDMEPFLGLRYPASDIPQQARELYKRSTLRLIADVDANVSPIVPRTSISGTPLDLSMAVTRAVSPIHLEYLRNMGVGASMSVSILKDGELWGLFACHHNKPHYVDYERRTAIELFAQFFSYELMQKSEQEARLQDQTARKLHDALMIRLSGGANLIDGFDVVAEELSGIVASDGIAVYSDGRFVSKGEAPAKEEFLKLVRFLNTAPTGEVFTTHRLPALYPPAQEFSGSIAGLMAIPISRTPRDYIVFFRREIAKSVKWAGNPQKPVEVGPNGVRLTPRKSFEAWNEVVRDTSSRWTERETRIGEALRISLIEIVLKLTDEANEERRKSADKQELLIAELNHRVRNILNLIQGIVSQSRGDASDIASFTKVLDGRIQAMARAHDQLTQQQWGPSSLRKLISVETEAYLGNSKNRVNVTGTSPGLAPEAFSTLALVLHEMVTNSAKYGGLADGSGSVSIDLTIPEDGALMIKWRETGGPPVNAPTRQGFGTTIIEKTIPYSLKGTVKTRYLLQGFEADIMIPSHYVTEENAPMAEETAQQLPTAPSKTFKAMGDFMIVEDNMIIAMDASDIISNDTGQKVHLASTVEAALALLDTHDIHFALLDVNLGDHMSLPVAEKLASMGIPFVLSTGYGDVESIAGNYPPVPIINKPFTATTLLQAIAQAANASD